MEPQNLNYEFDDVRVDVRNMQVWKAGQRLALEPKAFRVLVFLLEHAGRLVEKEELLTAIWADTFVTENALTRAIALLRKVLGDSTAQAKYIETVPTRGYRFIAAVSTTHERIETNSGTAGVAEASTAARPASKTEPKAAARVSSLPSLLRRRTLWLSLAVGGAVLLASLWLVVRRQQQVGEHPGHGPIQVTNSTALDIYPSFSPDGNTIAYSSNENGSFEIYLKQLTRGGRVVQLTNDGARNLQPAWSPDGRAIAYYSHAKGGIWLIPALGGVARQLTTSGSSPAWSPDGKEIAYQSGGIRDLGATSQISITGSTLWVAQVSDGVSRPITKVDKPEGAHNSPTWSPDGKTIAFVATGFKSRETLWAISADGSNLQKIGEAGSLYSPVFSRDGKYIYVSAFWGIWKIDLAGKRDKFGPKREKIFETIPEVSRYLAISADGRSIAFSRVSSISNIYSLPMSGGEAAGPPTPLTHDTRIRKTNPAISPDGHRVLFDVGSIDRNGGVWIVDTELKNSSPMLVPCESPAWVPGGRDFYCTQYVRRSNTNCESDDCFSVEVLKVNVATESSERVLTLDQNAEFLAYSRDGKQVAFMSLEKGPPNIWVVPTAGGAPKQITFDTESMGFPAWSPDGKFLAVEQKRGDNDNIWLVEPGKSQIQLTQAPGQNWPSSFSPDGEKIAFASNRDGSWNLWWVSRRDHTEKKLTSYSSLGDFVRYPDWSPDGKFIAYEFAETKGNIWMLESR
jgi:Tol biopolymer transport system component/DNA-binding winged helix-turn-helix (wHTH) protein